MEETNYPKVLSNYTSVYLALLFKQPNDAPIYSKPHVCKFLTVFQSATGSSRCACNPNQRQVRLTALVVLCKTDPRGWDTTPGEGEAQGTECTYAFVLQVVYQLWFLFVLEADRAPACSEELVSERSDT